MGSSGYNWPMNSGYNWNMNNMNNMNMNNMNMNMNMNNMNNMNYMNNMNMNRYMWNRPGVQQGYNYGKRSADAEPMMYGPWGYPRYMSYMNRPYHYGYFYQAPVFQLTSYTRKGKPDGNSCQ